MSDIIECRVENTAEDMGMTALCELPEEEAITPEEFVRKTEHTVEVAARFLEQESQNIELAGFDLKKVLSGAVVPHFHKVAKFK